MLWKGFGTIRTSTVGKREIPNIFNWKSGMKFFRSCDKQMIRGLILNGVIVK
jgi:hypothetical protein